MKILMIDDEPRGIESYKEDLELSEIEVVYCRKVDDAVRLLESSPMGFQLVILDIMMPPGETFRHHGSTQLGLRTGVCLYEWLRSHESDLPVIILTNVSDPKIVQRFQSEPNCVLLEKCDTFPYQLVDAVKDALKTTTP